MRQQRTNQVRRTYDPSDIPQYELLDWQVNPVALNQAQLFVPGVASRAKIKLPVAVWNLRLAETAAVQEIDGTNVLMTYSGPVKFTDEYEVRELLPSYRGPQGQIMKITRSGYGLPPPVMSWSVTAGAGTYTITISIPDAVGGLVINNGNTFQCSTNLEVGVVTSYGPNYIIVNFPSVIDEGWTIEVPGDTDGVTDGQGRWLAGGVQSVPPP